MRTIALAAFSLIAHAGISLLVYTVWGFPMFAVYSGLVTGGLAFDNLRHRQRYHDG